MYVVAAILAVVVHLVAGDASSHCKYPPNVEKFASSYYTAQVVKNDPRLVNSVALDGGEAAFAMYGELKKVLEEHRQCNAREAAFAGSHSLAGVDSFTLSAYFESAAYCIGLALNEYGLLDCDNAISRSLEYFNYVQKNFQGDKKNLVSYVHAGVYGWVEYFLSLGLKLDDFGIKSTKLFDAAFNEEVHNDTQKCKFDTSSH